MKIRYIFLVFEFICLMFFALPILSNILNPGNIAGIFASSLLIFITFFWDKFKELCNILWKHSLGKVLIIATGIVVLAGVIYALSLTGMMIFAKEKSPENAEAVIVLGCKVNGEKPSKMLKRRLDAAYEFLEENENVICVVSGGKGSDESISEAEAMKKYLCEKGIDDGRIIMEDKSVSTYENISNSCSILKENGISKEIAIVTDGFHQYRARFLAGRMDFNSSAINAVPDIYNVSLMPTYYVREWMAITNEYIKALKEDL